MKRRNFLSAAAVAAAGTAARPVLRRKRETIESGARTTDPSENLQEVVDTFGTGGTATSPKVITLLPGLYSGVRFQSQHSFLTLAAMFPGTAAIAGVEGLAPTGRFSLSSIGIDNNADNITIVGIRTTDCTRSITLSGTIGPVNLRVIDCILEALATSESPQRAVLIGPRGDGIVSFDNCDISTLAHGIETTSGVTYVRNCRIRTLDGGVSRETGVLRARSRSEIRAYGCHLEAVNVRTGGGTASCVLVPGTSTGIIRLYGCSLMASGREPFGVLLNGAGAGELVQLYGCSIDVRGNGSANAVGISQRGVYASIGRYYYTRINVSGGTPSSFDAQEDDAAQTVQLFNCDSNQVFDQPNLRVIDTQGANLQYDAR